MPIPSLDPSLSNAWTDIGFEPRVCRRLDKKHLTQPVFLKRLFFVGKIASRTLHMNSLIFPATPRFDELSDTSGINKWTCKCSYTYQGNHSYAVKSNCSTSCNCIPGIS
ncbi:uncharacterized protein LOC109010192 [Juglans regia]|uniref:Uncharacterized protein LOC109010192 n=1 Tax=Juglans regia TaxID=51240 RepID=A0A6P9EFY9_JUGRE|nr:uncharacterized protein LOC109010192 [Juglans regia]